MSEAKLIRAGILAYLDEESLEQLKTYGGILETAPQQVVIQEGEKQGHLYIVLSGEFDITTVGPSRTIHLERVETSDCFGEVAIFEPGVASATVTSLEQGSVWYTDVENLQNFLIDNPVGGCALMFGITTILSRRLKKTNQVIKAHEVLPSFLSVRGKKRPETTALPNVS